MKIDLGPYIIKTVFDLSVFFLVNPSFIFLHLAYPFQVCS
ncbi:Hypothetical protein Minf_1138 [Methylacidiphilum infernorum V4]|uniref:Uncharacterized protein n=1 Tax=Methylacidiphilum infernorum (isolate V4) TaxID=481448 RepID=B3DV40_METI4|nr:Hypothetical protein Minf_1138 [Methylacidiphilum infernorum V4]